MPTWSLETSLKWRLGKDNEEVSGQMKKDFCRERWDWGRFILYFKDKIWACLNANGKVPIEEEEDKYVRKRDE